MCCSFYCSIVICVLYCTQYLYGLPDGWCDDLRGAFDVRVRVRATPFLDLPQVVVRDRLRHLHRERVGARLSGTHRVPIVVLQLISHDLYSYCTHTSSNE